jgi:hypothetical protein
MPASGSMVGRSSASAGLSASPYQLRRDEDDNEHDTTEDLTTRQYHPHPEFWAGYRSTLRVAGGSQRMNKARVTRQLEKSLPHILSLPSCSRIRSGRNFGCG